MGLHAFVKDIPIEGSATTLKAVRDFEITEISKSISDFCLISGDF